ncbi:MAG TPA: tRNA (guanosine(37)-N1)-methyltransferase TrmD, partial [Solirubrobacterales bacterium]|nr:tRNA (guanosine(37)-N1)-methyltransferase TrmD [Solirubrobacterales bacterium]
MRLDVFTLFPEWFDWFLTQRHVRNAVTAGTELRFLDYRETTPLGAGQVDDSPYGGGAGMVMRVDVVDAALRAAYGEEARRRRTVLLTPSGRM